MRSCVRESSRHASILFDCSCICTIHLLRDSTTDIHAPKPRLSLPLSPSITRRSKIKLCSLRAICVCSSLPTRTCLKWSCLYIPCQLFEQMVCFANAYMRAWFNAYFYIRAAPIPVVSFFSVDSFLCITTTLLHFLRTSFLRFRYIYILFGPPQVTGIAFAR